MIWLHKIFNHNSLKFKEEKFTYKAGGGGQYFITISYMGKEVVEKRV